jgi:hypothetical protein
MSATFFFSLAMVVIIALNFAQLRGLDRSTGRTRHPLTWTALVVLVAAAIGTLLIGYADITT